MHLIIGREWHLQSPAEAMDPPTLSQVSGVSQSAVGLRALRLLSSFAEGFEVPRASSCQRAAVGASMQSPMSWSHSVNTAIVSHTSNIHQNDVDNCLGHVLACKIPRKELESCFSLQFSMLNYVFQELQELLQLFKWPTTYSFKDCTLY